MLYILLSNPPSGEEVRGTRIGYTTAANFLFFVDFISLFLVAFLSWILLSWWGWVLALVIILSICNLIGWVSIRFESVRGITVFINAMFNRTILSLIFLPSSLGLLFVSFILRKTYYSQWFPAVA